MNASRASDPRVDARIVSFGSRAFCLDRVLDPKRPARALASRFPRLRVSRILLKKKPLGRDDADHGTPSHSSTRRVPRPRVARLALVTRAPPRLAPPPRRECAIPDPCIPRVGRPEIQVTGFSADLASDSPGRIVRSTRVALTLTYAPPLSPCHPQPLRQGWLRLQARPPQRQG